MIAFGLMATASSLGVLRYAQMSWHELTQARFGVSTGYYTQHAFATEMSKFIGFPMLSLGIIFGDLDRRNEPLSYVIDTLILAAGWYLCEKKFKIRRYEMILYGVSVALMLATGENLWQNLKKLTYSYIQVVWLLYRCSDCTLHRRRISNGRIFRSWSIRNPQSELVSLLTRYSKCFIRMEFAQFLLIWNKL